MKRLLLILLLPCALLAQDAPVLTDSRMYQLLGEAHARIALQADYIALLQKKILELQDALKAKP